MVEVTNRKKVMLILAVASLASVENAETDDGPLVTFGDVKIVQIIGDMIIRAKYIDEERGNPGNFIYANNYALRFLDESGHYRSFVGLSGATAAFDGIGTNAAFGTINHFSQFSDDEIFVPDLFNGCIRHIQKSTKNVTGFIGKCGRTSDTYLPSKERPNVERSETTMSAPTRVSYREDQNLFYILEHKRLLTYSPQTSRVSLFFDISEQNVTFPSDMLWSADKRLLYISHAYGISTLNIETKHWTPVARNGPDSNNGTTLMDAQIGRGLGGIDWLIPDRLLILADTWAHRISVYNLLEDSVSYLCKRTEDIDHDALVTGDMDTCKVTSPEAMKVINGTVYTSSVDGRPTDPTMTSQFIHMSFNIPECTLPETNGSISFQPLRERYFYADQIEVICPHGQSVLDLYSTLTCTRDHNRTTDQLGGWDNPLPQCGDPELTDIHPDEGQRAGGTLIMANGSFPTTMYPQVKDGVHATNVTFTGLYP